MGTWLAGLLAEIWVVIVPPASSGERGCLQDHSSAVLEPGHGITSGSAIESADGRPVTRAVYLCGSRCIPGVGLRSCQTVSMTIIEQGCSWITGLLLDLLSCLRSQVCYCMGGYSSHQVIGGQVCLGRAGLKTGPEVASGNTAKLRPAVLLGAQTGIPAATFWVSRIDPRPWKSRVGTESQNSVKVHSQG